MTRGGQVNDFCLTSRSFWG